jgi:hypothetical protein
MLSSVEKPNCRIAVNAFLILRGSLLSGVRIVAERTAGNKGQLDTAIDPAIKDLVDNLLIPYLVEEFLRLHGPTAIRGQQAATITSSPVSLHSELDSTP